jgi:hypothetical protein
VPNIFVSYRRDDSAAGYVISLRDRLAQRFGPEAAFLDIDRIAYGDDFAQVIKTQSGMSRVDRQGVDDVPERVGTAPSR